MFIDHKEGRTRFTYEVGDLCRFRHPESIISSYALEYDEHKKEKKNVCLSDIIPQMSPIEIKECFYHDPRKPTELNMHKYTICFGGRTFFNVCEYDLWMEIE